MADPASVYEDDDEDCLDFGETSSVLKDVGPLELAPVDEEQAPSFSDTLQQHIKDTSQSNVKKLDIDDKRGIQVKGTLHRLTSYCEKKSNASNFSFQAEVEPAHIDVKLSNFEKVAVALIDECCQIGSLSALLLSTQMEYGDYVFRITGFLIGEPAKKPRHISQSLAAKAKQLGMELDYRYKTGSRVDYDIAVKLSADEA